MSLYITKSNAIRCGPVKNRILKIDEIDDSYDDNDKIDYTVNEDNYIIIWNLIHEILSNHLNNNNITGMPSCYLDNDNYTFHMSYSTITNESAIEKPNTSYSVDNMIVKDNDLHKLFDR